MLSDEKPAVNHAAVDLTLKEVAYSLRYREMGPSEAAADAST